MAERPRETKLVDLSQLVDKKVTFSIGTAEAPDELQSRLRREEVEAEHNLRAREAEDAHQRRISLIIHIFVMVIVVIAFLTSVYIAVAKDPKTGVPDKAMGIITAIVAAAVGYMTGKESQVALRRPEALFGHGSSNRVIPQAAGMEPFWEDEAPAEPAVTTGSPGGSPPRGKPRSLDHPVAIALEPHERRRLPHPLLLSLRSAASARS